MDQHSGCQHQNPDKCRLFKILFETPKKVMTFKKKFGMNPKNYKTHKEMMDKYNEKQIDDPA